MSSTDDIFEILSPGSGPYEELQAHLRARREEMFATDELVRQVREILLRVKRGGRPALAGLVQRFDSCGLEADELVVDPADHAPSTRDVSAAFRRGLRLSVQRVETFSKLQLPTGFVHKDEVGRFTEVISPLESVGCYVPGGRAAYPSTAVMTVVPARVAGVERICVATPPRTFFDTPELRWTLAELGVTEVLLAGGAHALGALAFGLEGFAPVLKIVGPGNRWVNTAKRLLFGHVAVDTLAGPSELLVIADETANATFVAADLLAQAEHDAQAVALLLTCSTEFAEKVSRALVRGLNGLPAESPAWESMALYGGAVILPDIAEAIRWTEEFAPEHLHINCRGASELASKVRNCGAVFVGPASGEVFGDYLAGPNQVLPTGGGSRVASPLSTLDFVRRSHVLELHRDGAEALIAATMALAEAEGLPGHARSAEIRRRPKKKRETTKMAKMEKKDA